MQPHAKKKKEKKRIRNPNKNSSVSNRVLLSRKKKKKRKNSIFHWQDSRREIGNDRSIDRRGNEGKSPGIGCELARFLAGLKESAANGARTTQRRAQKSSFVDRAEGERGGEDDRETRHSNFGSLHALRGFWSGMTRRNDDAAMAPLPPLFPSPRRRIESIRSKGGPPALLDNGWKNGRWENAP